MQEAYASSSINALNALQQALPELHPLHQLAEHFPGTLYIYQLYPDGRSRFPFSTAGIEAIYGWPSHQLTEDASPVFDRILSEDLARVSASIHASAQQLCLWEEQYRVRHPQRGERWIQGRATPQRLEDGSILWHGYLYDITESKQQALALEQAQTRIQLAMEATDTGLWQWDLERNRLNWSDEAYTQLGYAPQAFPLTLRRFLKLIHPDDKARSIALIQQHTRQQRAFMVDFRLRHAHQSWTWVQCRGKVIQYDVDQQPSLMMGTHTNISHLKQIQAELEEARQLAEQANLAKSSFLANMSHEIRTPMNGILGLSQISFDESDPQILRQRLHQIDQEGHQLLGLLNDILDLSRIEAGKLQIEHAPFSLTLLIDTLKSLYSRLAEEKNLALIIELDPHLEEAYLGDPMRLKQVLSNLLSNAIKFTDHGEVKLSLRLEGTQCHQGRHAHQISLSVQDTGIGIAPEQQQHLFQAFSQASSSTARHYGGSGLGLLISQHLVQSLGGQGIELESALGAGSHFHFQLRLTPCCAEEHQALLQQGERRGRSSQTLGGQVLLVEDNAINQQVARVQLEQLGLTVYLAEHGQAALDFLQTQDVDLILMDVQMPIMDGYEATRRLRAQGVTLPIIALTAAAMPEDQQRAKAAGMNGHLAKPISAQQLYQALAPYLAIQRPIKEDHPPLTQTCNQMSEKASLLVINTHQAHQLLAGDTALYQRLTRQFVADFPQRFQPLVDQLDQLSPESPAEDFHAAQQLAHALKGVAGNLAFDALAAATSTLDHTLRQARCPRQQDIRHWQQQIAQLFTALETPSALDATPTPLHNGATLDSIQPLLAQLYQQLGEHEMIYEDQLAPLRQALHAWPQSLRLWQQLEQQIDQLELDQAAQTVSHLLEQLKEG
ncbi:PAS domain-containing protein [Marinospirillum sp.]|uniref:hybrid sensor histidine kinase/response regulator n=1 Tax=Marinospirillum sp. TaxID=2183934 RepID=UPI003A8377CB